MSTVYLPDSRRETETHMKLLRTPTKRSVVLLNKVPTNLIFWNIVVCVIHSRGRVSGSGSRCCWRYSGDSISPTSRGTDCLWWQMLIGRSIWLLWTVIAVHAYCCGVGCHDLAVGYREERDGDWGSETFRRAGDRETRYEGMIQDKWWKMWYEFVDLTRRACGD